MRHVDISVGRHRVEDGEDLFDLFGPHMLRNVLTASQPSGLLPVMGKSERCLATDRQVRHPQGRRRSLHVPTLILILSLVGI